MSASARAVPIDAGSEEAGLERTSSTIACSDTPSPTVEMKMR
jgi:hypothetical protein